MLAGKGFVRAGSGNKNGKGIVGAGSENKKRIVRAGTGKDWDFNAVSSFNKLWNTKVLSKWTKI